MANGKVWLKEHGALMELMISLGCTHDLIAQLTGHCVDTVQRRASLLGLTEARGVKYGSWADLPPSALEAIRDLTS